MNNTAILLFGGGVGFRPVKLLVLIYHYNSSVAIITDSHHILLRSADA